MLYVSTRDQTNTYTAHRALFEQHASDGGMFVPFRMPEFTQDEILQMKTNSFGNNVAQILNLFFSAQLTGWDVDFCCGRRPVEILTYPRKLLVAEAWHNTAACYEHIERALYEKLCGEHTPEKISGWAKIAIRIALYFAVYALHTSDNSVDELDFAVDDNSFVAPMAAWYARRMGLPIANIICGSCDSGAVWDIIHRGELNPASCGQILGLEQLIYATFGQDESLRFVEACQKRRSYLLDEDASAVLNKGMFVAVIGPERIGNVITSFRQNNDCLLDTAAAISYAALQDYRTRTGESKATMIFSLHKSQNDHAV